MGKLVLILATIGLVVPISSIMATKHFHILYPSWIIYVWPSSIFLMATDGFENTTYSTVITMISVAVNMGLYCTVGFIVYVLFGRIFK